MMNTYLNQPVTVLKGVGKKRQTALNDLGIYSLYDLLLYFPFRHEDLTVKDLHEVEDKQKIVIEGKVLRPPVLNYFGRHRSRLMFHLETEAVVIPVIFFNQPYYKQQVQPGRVLQVFGTWDESRQQLMGMRILSKVAEDENYDPIYPASKAIKSNTIAKLVKQAWQLSHEQIPEILPQALREKYALATFKATLAGIHFPEDEASFQTARRTFAFMELFSYQLRMALLRQKHLQQGQALLYDNKKLQSFFETLPFELTNAQKRVVNEISADLRRPEQMFRLLQGDVGSGKTVVAAAAIFAVWTVQGQAALMVPTEILAIQHYDTLKKMFAPFDLRVELLTGTTSAADRKECLAALKRGEIDLIVGTHALIQEPVQFKALRLVLIDEQHRFGVNQRRKLRQKGQEPDVLFMTATPIPRTLSMTAFGEMQVSSIDELPPHRKPIKTHWIKPTQLASLFKWLQPQLNEGSQLYVISPLIAEGEQAEVETIDSLVKMYRKNLAKVARIDYLHGQMSSEEKEQIMERFAEHQTDILISTTVIEVGIDVPNAVGIIIHNADRFGLSQLHQLRGRVGRGEKESFCILVAQPKTEEARQRLQIMETETDGFILSQKDLEMRGPGDWFGQNQSGSIDFKMADLVHDEAMIAVAAYEAEQLLQNKAMFKDKKYRHLIEFAQLDETQQKLLD